MHAITVSRRVNAPIDTVFRTFSDLTNAPERVRGIKRLELINEGPMRAGTRFRETRVMFGHESTEEMEVTAFEPDRGYTIGCTNHGSRFETRFDFAPVGDGTEVTMTFRITPLTLMARMMAPLAGMMAHTIQKCIHDDLDDLKQAAEACARA